MDGRERARRILSHMEADRPAIDLGSTRMTGTSAWTYRALKGALGLPSDGVRVYDLCQMLVEVEAKVIPHFIDAGVDCLNPVQWTAKGMDLSWLKRTFGDKLVFWGGAISTQRTFPFGTPEDVAREAQQVLDTMSPGGGSVVNPIHNVLPEVPVKNIVALYRTAQNYRYSGSR